MRLIQATALSSFDEYHIVEAPTPEPGEGEVLIRIAACSVGYVDALTALGGYQVKPPLPFTPGAEVSATASSAENRDFAAHHGAHQVLDANPSGWRDRLKAITGGKGVDVVYDPVCGPLFELAFRSLAWGGRHLVVGFVGGPIPALPANLTLMKGADLIGVDIRQFGLFEAEKATANQ